MAEKKDDGKRSIPTFDHDVFGKRDRGGDKGQESSVPKNDGLVVSNTFKPPEPPVKKSEES